MLRAIRNLDYVVLLCRDLQATRSFYQDVMGFQVYRDWGEWVEFRVGATLLALRPRGRPYDGPLSAQIAGVQLAFRVAPDQVEPCYGDLAAKGVEMLEALEDRSSGHRTIFFRDPEGNVLEIYAELAAPDFSRTPDAVMSATAGRGEP
ncbi:MAG: VOC family protein [Gemmatimonadota bacterium]